MTEDEKAQLLGMVDGWRSEAESALTLARDSADEPTARRWQSISKAIDLCANKLQRWVLDR